MPEKFVAGNRGPGIRSDCYVSLEPEKTGGIDIELNSRVKALYGDHIKDLAKGILDFYSLKNVRLCIEDSGSLDFVIASRIEAVVKQMTGTEEEYLPQMIPQNVYTTEKDRFRFTRLYLPGNNPSLMINAGIHGPDGIILDLEDSVSPGRKQEAALLVRNALRQVDFYGSERMVRINQVPYGLDDLKYVIPHNVNLILIPKCEIPEHISRIEMEIERLSKIHGIKHKVWLMPIIESALGIENAFLIASASENIVAMAIGLEDFTADLGVRRTMEAKETFFGRTRLVNACKAAGIQAIDSVFSDVDDISGLMDTVRVSRSLGFEGMGCIHPRQVRVIQDEYKPGGDEIERAAKIVKAYESAIEQGLGVVALGSKMIDQPVVKRARRIIDLALDLKIINSDWREKYGN